MQVKQKKKRMRGKMKERSILKWQSWKLKERGKDIEMLSESDESECENEESDSKIVSMIIMKIKEKLEIVC